MVVIVPPADHSGCMEPIEVAHLIHKAVAKERTTLLAELAPLLDQVEAALDKAHTRLGLVATAPTRGFDHAYIEGCATAGREEIDAALAALRAWRKKP